jgi:TPP-dependent pyruvate/acetoin dehydrogenase alpha subunit
MTEAIHDIRVRRLETLMLIRAYEEQAVELQRNGAPGTCTSVGQEAAAELARWRDHDPIRVQTERLIAEGLVDAAGVAAIEQRVRAQIADAAFAQASAWPSAEKLTEHVYA